MNARGAVGQALGLAGAACASAALVLYVGGPLGALAGCLLALVLPGAAMVTAIPATRVLGWAERATLSVTLSLGTVILGGIALHAADLRLTTTTWTSLCLGVTLAGAAVGPLAGCRSPLAPQPPAGELSRGTLGAPALWQRLTSRLVPLAVALALVGVAGWLSLASARQQPQNPFTALWITPTSQPDQVTVGVQSHETRTTLFLVRVRAETTAAAVAGFQMMLASGEQWSTTVTVPATELVVAELYRDGDDSTPYRWVELSATREPS